MNFYNYIIEDSRNIEEVFRTQEIGKPNVIITSPPYFDVKNYEGSKKQIGYGQDYDTYLNDIINIFQKCYEISSSHATFWIVCDTFKKDGTTVPLPFDINRELINNFSPTWNLMDIIIWNKAKNIPWNSKGRFKNHFEYIFFYAKDTEFKFNIDSVREVSDLKKWWLTYPERYNPKGKAPSNVWESIIPMQGWGNGCLNHYCPFPFSLVEKIISISSNENDLVFDPFAGSGSVLAMAYVMNRNSVGIDINRKYKNQFENHVLMGAKNYWIKRKEELLFIDKKIKKFKLINNELRKNKLGSIIIQKIKSNYDNNDENIYLIAENNKKDIIDCIIFDAKMDFLLIDQDEEIRNLIKEFKIKVNWIITNKRDNLKPFFNIEFYKYNLNNIHQYISQIALEEIIAEEKRDRYFYSNIKLDIPNANDLFKEEF